MKELRIFFFIATDSNATQRLALQDATSSRRGGAQEENQKPQNSELILNQGTATLNGSVPQKEGQASDTEITGSHLFL